LVNSGLTGWKSSSGLIAGTLVGQFAALLLLLIFIYCKYGTLIIHAISQEKVKQSFFKYKVYPFYMTPYTLVGTIRDRLVYFLLANFGGRSEVGFYNLSSRLVNMPNSLLSSAIRPVFFQRAASTDFRSLEGLINRALHSLAICVVPFWILFLFHAKTLFALVFGEPWREAGLYASILSVPAIPLLLGNWLDRAFDVLGRQRLAFTLELVFSGISVGVWHRNSYFKKYNSQGQFGRCLDVTILLAQRYSTARFDHVELLKLAGLFAPILVLLFSFGCSVVCQCSCDCRYECCCHSMGRYLFTTAMEKFETRPIPLKFMIAIVDYGISNVSSMIED
jgi:hypothetical protein